MPNASKTSFSSCLRHEMFSPLRVFVPPIISLKLGLEKLGYWYNNALYNLRISGDMLILFPLEFEKNFCYPGMYWNHALVSNHVTESTAVLDSGFRPSGFRIPLFCIPDSTLLYSGFQEKPKSLGFSFRFSKALSLQWFFTLANNIVMFFCLHFHPFLFVFLFWAAFAFFNRFLFWNLLWVSWTYKDFWKLHEL